MPAIVSKRITIIFRDCEAHQQASHEVGGFSIEAFRKGIIELLYLLPCQILG